MCKSLDVNKFVYLVSLDNLHDKVFWFGLFDLWYSSHIFLFPFFCRILKLTQMTCFLKSVLLYATISYYSSWQRETRIRNFGGRLQGEVAYFAPCGKKLRQYPEVVKVHSFFNFCILMLVSMLAIKICNIFLSNRDSYFLWCEV